MLALVMLCSVVLEDGSQINAVLNTPTIPIKTAYGELSVPVKDIITITFATRSSDPKSVRALVKRLEGNVFQDRDKASKELIALGRPVIPYLQSNDPEARKRIVSITEAITDPRPVVAVDTIVAKHMTVTGTITVQSLSFTSKILGDKTVALCDLTSIAMPQATTTTELGVNGWKSFGSVNKGSKVTASGVIDFWPMTPGQFVSSPKGSISCTQNGLWFGGSLLGKIGDREFYIGEEGTVPVAGELLLRIVPSTWNVQPLGQYKVTVKR